jgi:hypothetical protein
MRSGVALVFLAAACVEVRAAHALIEDATPSDRDPASFKVEYRAGAGERTLIVRAPDGRVVGCRAAGGASWLLNSENLDHGCPFDPIADGAMSLRWPGVKMSISEDDRGEPERVAIMLDRGGERVQITADEPEGDHRAHVLISGANEWTLRDFISQTGGWSPEVRAQLLSKLGLATS